MLSDNLEELLKVVNSKRALFTDALNSAGKRNNSLFKTDISYELVKRKLYDFNEKRARS